MLLPVEMKCLELKNKNWLENFLIVVDTSFRNESVFDELCIQFFFLILAPKFSERDNLFNDVSLQIWQALLTSASTGDNYDLSFSIRFLLKCISSGLQDPAVLLSQMIT